MIDLKYQSDNWMNEHGQPLVIGLPVLTPSNDLYFVVELCLDDATRDLMAGLALPNNYEVSAWEPAYELRPAKVSK